MSDLDAIIIGAGHNGLTCAAYLGMAGLRARVFERRNVVGGACVTEEFHSGFRNSTAAYTVSLLQPKVIRDLDLHRHGLRIVERRAQNFLPLPDGRYLLTGEGRSETKSPSSAPDAARYADYQAEIGRVAACCAVSCSRRRPIWRCAISPRTRELGKLAGSASGCGRPTAQGGVQPLAQIGRRHARWLVRIRSDQGRARLRCRGRQSGESRTRRAPPMCCCIMCSAK